MPTVPGGFTVSVYAEMPTPRMMVYAPNGDLFVSSPAANNITVLRDANNDGVFEERSVYAQGEAPPRRGGGGGGGGGARPGGAGWRRRSGRPPPPPPPPAAEVNPAINGRDPRRERARVCAAAGRLRHARPGHAVGAVRARVPQRVSLRRHDQRAHPLQVHAAGSDGAGRAGKAAGLPHRRPLHAQHRLQPRRHEDVHRRRIGVEQQRRRGLPARRGARVQSRRHRLSHLRLRHPQPGRPDAAAGHRHDLGRRQRARQPRRRSRPRLRDVGQGRRLLRLAVFLHRPELRSALRRRVPGSRQARHRA